MILYIFIFLFCALVSINLAAKFPSQFFFLFISLYADPGGYIRFYTNDLMQGAIRINELFYYLSFLPFLFKKNIFREAFKNTTVKKIFIFLIVFDLYYIIVYGILTPALYGRLDFLFFLFKNRIFLTTPFLIISTYLLAKDKLKYFFHFTIFISSVFLTLYFITLLTNIPLIPIASFERYSDSGINRLTMLSYGFFDIVLPLAFITYNLKINTKNKYWLYYAGILMAVTITITLTRRTYIYTLTCLLISYYINSKLLNISLESIFKKIVIPILVFIIILGIIFPKYVSYAQNLFSDLITLATTGKNSQGEEDYRFAGTEGVLFIKKTFYENPLFGTGYMYEWFDSTDDFHGGKYKAHDNPFWGSLAVFGIIGSILNLMLYGFILKLISNTLKILRVRFHEIKQNNSFIYVTIFTVFISASFLSFFLTQFFSYNTDLFYVNTRIYFLFLFGILIITNEKLKQTQVPITKVINE